MCRASSEVIPEKSALGSMARGIPISASTGARSVLVSVLKRGSERLTIAGERAPAIVSKPAASRLRSKAVMSFGTMIVMASDPPT